MGLLGFCPGLQDYIKGVEAIAAARKDQLERIYEEKREQERVSTWPGD